MEWDIFQWKCLMLLVLFQALLKEEWVEFEKRKICNLFGAKKQQHRDWETNFWIILELHMFYFILLTFLEEQMKRGKKQEDMIQSMMLNGLLMKSIRKKKKKKFWVFEKSNDLFFLICSWVFNNLWGRWGTIVRRHTATSKKLKYKFKKEKKRFKTKMSENK